MKTIEEKSKAYDEALERAKTLYENANGMILKKWVEQVFPELKESEDERIRKDIVRFIQMEVEDEIVGNKWIAWLEKQGERKPFDYENANIQQKDFASIEPKFKVGDKIIEKDFDECGCGTIIDIKDGKYIFDDGGCISIEEQGLWELVEQKLAEKVEPKFKVGDWVVFNNKHQSIYQVEKIEDGYYILRHTHGGTFRVCVLHDESLRLWTIQDAKDGDLIYDGNAACIFRNTMEDDDAIWVDTYCGINIDNEFKVNDEDECWCLSKDCSPATKEQRDTLMKAMADAGYVFDFGKKELKEIEV